MDSHTEKLPLSNMPKVAIVVLTWNGKSLTLECLESLGKLTYGNVEIIVVDNGSTDGTEEAVRKAFGDKVMIIQNGANLGFSQGNNAGIDYALRNGADFILLLNNDTVADPDLITHLVEAMCSSPENGIAGPKIFYHDPSDCIWFAGGEVFLWRGIARHTGIREKDRGQYNEQRRVDYITGCALMVKREVIEKIGKLDSSYAAYFEDTDLCMRARLAGYRNIYVPNGKVWHKISQSTGGQVSYKKISSKLKSSFRFFGRYAKPYHWLTIPFFFALDVIRIIFLISIGKIRDTRERTA